jgi:DNA-binding transcriptional LysR family regulator
MICVVDLEDTIMGGAEYAELTAFMVIAETRSFREASRRLGVTPSALSRTIRKLETRLELRLLNRTTRSVSPTEAGTILYDKLVPLIAGLQTAVGDAIALRSEPVGTVRLNVPRLAAELILWPRLARFHELFPGVRLDIVIDDGLTDIVAKGFDAGIRIGGRLPRDMIAIPLTAEYRKAVVGSPGYFADHPVPRTPQDLRDHDCITYRWIPAGQPCRWSFDGPDGAFEVEVDGTLAVNDTGLMRDAVLDGLGLAFLPEAVFEPHIASGTLVRVLEPWCKPFPGFYLYHPSRRQTPPALRALISFLQTEPLRSA